MVGWSSRSPTNGALVVIKASFFPTIIVQERAVLSTRSFFLRKDDKICLRWLEEKKRVDQMVIDISNDESHWQESVQKYDSKKKNTIPQE